ncbi:MAG: hypothetical protein IIX65_02955 [Lachnospiraceae bacterium]|nr:hypothetical protein [Lachnospiraceae bacterium]
MSGSPIIQDGKLVGW